MNAQTQDQSYFKMVAEHQDISARVLRLHNILNHHHCVQHMPTEACSLINEMKNIVETGTAQPGGLQSADLNFDFDLPYTDPEQDVDHDFQVGDLLSIKNEFAQHKFKAIADDRFEVIELAGKDQLYVCQTNKPNQCITAHYTHFTKVTGEKSCVV